MHGKYKEIKKESMVHTYPSSIKCFFIDFFVVLI